MSFDGALEHLVSFDNQSYKEIFKNHIEKTIIGIDKYNVPPVYSLQFAMNRVNYQTQPILMSIDDNVSIIKGTIDNFESIVRDNRTNFVPPTVIVSPQLVPLKTLILGEMCRPPIAFTPFYLVVGSELKKYIDDGTIGSTHVYTNKQRDRFVVRLGNANNEPLSDAFSNMLFMNTAIAYPLKLPFINFANVVNKNYIPIVDAIRSDIMVSFDKDKCNDLWSAIQASGVYELAINDPIHIYKDFIKQKPNRMNLYWAKSIIDSDGKIREVMNICLDLFYDTYKLHHVVFYRYLLTEN